MAAGSHSESEILLSTKLRMPRPRRDYVVRRALFRRLSRCREMSIVFIRGAAGTGKTTLVSSFLMETGLKPYAWLSLDQSNDRVFSFWPYFIAAAGTLLQDADGLTPAPLFLDRDNLRRDIIFLINRLCGETDCYLVLDDFHVIRDPELIESLELFLQSMPDNLHLLLLSREDPPVYLGALAVSGRLLYISGDDMKFSDDESLQFLKSTMKLQADDAELKKISRFAEGWVGGLQLAAAGGSLSDGLLRQGGGFATEYLTREVFEKLSPEEQDFLVCTGTFPWFSADISSAVFGSLDFLSMLDSLLRKNLFVVCVDEEKGIYRYHNILGEYLSRRFQEMPAQRQQEIRRKAAVGFVQAGDLGEAARLLTLAGDYAAAAAVILEMPMDAGTGACIDGLPMEWLVRNIDLMTRSMVYHIDCGDMARFGELCDAALAQWDNAPLCGLIRYARSLLGGTMHAAHAPLISADDIVGLHLRPETAVFILIGVGNLLALDRKYPLAVQYADKAREMIPDKGFDSLRFYVYELKAQLSEETGQLNDSLENYRRIQQLFERKSPAFMARYDYLIGIAGIYLKRMELPQAKKVLDEARTMLTWKAIPEDMVRFSLVYNDAEYHILSGRTEDGIRQIQECIRSGIILSRTDRLLIEMDVAGGISPPLRERILAEYTRCRAHGRTLSPAFELLTARLYFEQGREADALAIIQSVLAFSRETQNRLHLVEADLLLMRMTEDRTPAGRRKRNNLLREAIYYAWENRLMMPFCLEKKWLVPLLRDFTASLAGQLSEEERRFVRDILVICSAGSDGSPAEVLSPREREVLAQMGQRKTNPQIAQALCISLATVKSHALSIYGKLGVSSREDAVEEARRLNLL